MFNRFHSIFKKVVDKHLPLRPYTNKELHRLENPWLTNGLYKAIKTKNKLYFKKLRKRTIAAENVYKRHRNLLNRMIKKAKSDYYKEKLEASGNNSKKIWIVINEILAKRKKQMSIKRVKKKNGNKTSSSSETANTFNKYFVDVGIELAEKIPTTSHQMFCQRV